MSWYTGDVNYYKEMKQQKIIATVTLVVSLISFSAMNAIPVWAVTKTTPVATAAMANKAAARLASVRANADKEIDRRVAVLNKLVTKLGVLKRVTDAQKATLTAQVQSEISNLMALKAKIDADTDLTTLKADKKSIVDSYRVFLLFVPQVTITAHADRILNVATALQTLADKLSTRIDAAKTAGKNVTAASAKLADMNAKIADAITQANNAITAVGGLTPSGYPGNKGTLSDARKMLATARTDLRMARQDVAGVRAGLKTK